MINNQTHSVRRVKDKTFIQAYRTILKSKNLSWGQKCLMYAILDTPPTSKIVWATIARKLGVAPSQVHRWRSTIRDWYSKEAQQTDL